VKIDILTIFPDFFRGPLDYGIVRRAREAGLAELHVHDLRAFAHDRHRTVDDRPFGGGEGMVLKPEPIFECIETLGLPPWEERTAGSTKQSVILLSAQGRRFNQMVAEELAATERIVLVCGRYEGVDERVSEFLADRELSIGDFVLSGGELGAAVIVDTVTRLIPGAVGNEASTRQESFSRYTRNRARVRVRTRPALPGACWIIRITRGRRSFAGCRCRRFLYPVTTMKSGAGDGAWLWKRRCVIAQTC
jgi:tRNA (guanine37-N1)-methyltransferase